ncbi:MAG: hypothetical protein AAFV93_09050, partial [Chloroflexota bacterium]
MIERVGMFGRLRPNIVLLEAGLLGLFFVQALRYMIGALYSRVASATLVTSYADGSFDPAIAGVVDPSIVSNEVILLGLVVALPLLSLLLGRLRFAPLIGMIVVVIGRTLMTFPVEGITPLMASEIAVGGGLFAICCWVAQRNNSVPFLFVLGFGFDQLIRAFGNTLDPTIFGASRTVTLSLGVAVVSIDFFTVLIML